jgi:hypothetical protein
LTSSPKELKSFLLDSLEFMKKRLIQIRKFMKCYWLQELGAQEDYQILKMKLRKVEEKVTKVIDKRNKVAYSKVKKKVEE